MLVDRFERVICMNAAARTALGDGLLISQSRLRAAARAADARLQALIRQVTARGTDQVLDAVAVPRADGRPIIVQATSLPDKSFGDANALVTLNPLEKPSDLAVQRLAQAFGLTTAECNLARRLARGEGLPEAARLSGVSLNTVRTHMKSIFAKTDTHSQSEVASLLSRAGYGLWCGDAEPARRRSGAER